MARLPFWSKAASRFPKPCSPSMTNISTGRTAATFCACRKQGGGIVDVYRNPSTAPTLQLQQDADGFYFCQMNTMGDSHLVKLNKKTGELKSLAPSINHTMEFTVSDGWIYYFSEVQGEGS